MATPVIIKSPSNGNSALVSDEGELLVATSPLPPSSVADDLVPFVGRATVNGDGVTSALNVDGSVNPVRAYLQSDPNDDIYLTSANILIADNGVVKLNLFGSEPALTNGVDIFYSTRGSENILISGIKTNFDFIRVGSLTRGTGGKTDAFQLANSDAANNDGYNPIIDLSRTSPSGLRLQADSGSRVGVIIRDNLTAIATFNILFVGFRRILRN